MSTLCDRLTLEGSLPVGRLFIICWRKFADYGCHMPSQKGARFNSASLYIFLLEVMRRELQKMGFLSKISQTVEEGGMGIRKLYDDVKILQWKPGRNLVNSILCL